MSGLSAEPYLVVKEMHSVIVELQRERLQEGDVVGHDLLVREVEFMHNDGVDVVIRQQVVWRRKQAIKAERDKSASKVNRLRSERLHRDVS